MLQKPQKTKGESMLEEEIPCDRLPFLQCNQFMAGSPFVEISSELTQQLMVNHVEATFFAMISLESSIIRLQGVTSPVRSELSTTMVSWEVW